MAGRFAKSEFYSRIVTYFTIFVSATIIVISSVFYLSVERMVTRLVSSSVLDGLYQARFSAQLLTDTARVSALQVYWDTSITPLFFRDEPSPEELNTALERLRMYRSATSYIDSIYVYNGSVRMFYVSSDAAANMVSSEDRYFDQNAVDIVTHPGRYRFLIPIRRDILRDPARLTGRRVFSVFSFLYSDDFQPSDGLRTAVLVNISEEWIKEIITSLDSGIESTTLIVDGSGVLLASDSPTPEILGSAVDDIVAAIREDGTESGYSLHDISGKRFLVTSIASEALEWTFVKMTPYAAINRKVNDFRIMMIAAAAAVLAAGLILSVILSRRLYSPFDKLLKKLRLLESERIRNAMILKQNFFSRLTKGKIGASANEENLTAPMIDLRIDLEQPLVVVILMLDRYADLCSNFSHAERDLIKAGISGIALMS